MSGRRAGRTTFGNRAVTSQRAALDEVNPEEGLRHQIKSHLIAQGRSCGQHSGTWIPEGFQSKPQKRSFTSVERLAHARVFSREGVGRASELHQESQLG